MVDGHVGFIINQLAKITKEIFMGGSYGDT